MITASHCTNTQGGVENTPYYQPLQSSQPIQVAREVADPAYQRNLPGCPKGRVCRRSDAARALYINGITGAVGVIARTSGANNGSLEVSGSFTITTDDANNSTPVGAHGSEVRLLGVLWGGGGGQFVFSPLQNVIQELGPLTTH
jgi:hypothetical protein